MLENKVQTFNFRQQKATLDDIIAVFSKYGEVFSKELVPVEFFLFAERFGFSLDVIAHVAGQHPYPGWRIVPSTVEPITADIRIGDEVSDKTGKLNNGLRMTVTDVNRLQALVTYYDAADIETWANKTHLVLHSRPRPPFI
jgi:hypothetical protein